MLTKTTSPSCASATPLNTGLPLVPLVYPPPWIENMTGRLPPSFNAGV